MEAARSGDIRSVKRATEILSYVAQRRHPVQLAALSAELGIPKSTVLGICRTLVAARLLDRDRASGAYRLGSEVLELSSAYLRDLDVVREFQEVVGQVPSLAEETVQLALPNGAWVVHIAKRMGRWPVQLTANMGQSLPASCAATGRAILSGWDEPVVRDLYERGGQHLVALTKKSPRTLDELLPELREARLRGYAVDDEATAEGIMCLAAPVFELVSTDPMAAISVTFVKARLSPTLLEHLSRGIVEAARLLSYRMGWRPDVGAGAPPAGVS